MFLKIDCVLTNSGYLDKMLQHASFYIGNLKVLFDMFPVNIGLSKYIGAVVHPKGILLNFN